MDDNLSLGLKNNMGCFHGLTKFCLTLNLKNIEYFFFLKKCTIVRDFLSEIDVLQIYIYFLGGVM